MCAFPKIKDHLGHIQIMHYPFLCLIVFTRHNEQLHSQWGFMLWISIGTKFHSRSQVIVYTIQDMKKMVGLLYHSRECLTPFYNALSLQESD